MLTWWYFSHTLYGETALLGHICKNIKCIFFYQNTTTFLTSNCDKKKTNNLETIEKVVGTAVHDSYLVSYL